MNDLFYKEVLINDNILNDKILQLLLKLEWTSDTYFIYGKEVIPARKTIMYGKDYSYSGIKKEAHEFTGLIHVLANEIEIKMKLPLGYFNACLLNLYPDGNAGLSYHKDDEPEMVKEAPIVSLSFGTTRKFYLKDDITKEVTKISHNAGEIIVMNYGVQELFTHAIPKEPKIVLPRVSLTFRRFNKEII